jgi:RNA recognition motif-containing protein
MLVLSNAYVVCFRFDSRYGEIANINLVRDKKTGKTKGFAFICYEDQRSTVLAVDNFNATKVRFSRFIALISPNFGMSSPYVS